MYMHNGNCALYNFINGLCVFPIFLIVFFQLFVFDILKFFFAHQAALTVFQSEGAIHFLEVRYNPSKPPDSVSLMTPNIKDIFKYFIFYKG